MFCSSAVIAENIIFSDAALGKLKLSKQELISLDTVRSAFPNLEIKHEIGHGDSSDFHYIEARNDLGELLFILYSYFDEDVDKNSTQYDIDLVVVISHTIPDQMGVRVGDRVSKVIGKKGDNFELYANHQDNSIGIGSLYYQFTLAPNILIDEAGNRFLNPEKVTKSDVMQENPKIKSISWSSPVW